MYIIYITNIDVKYDVYSYHIACNKSTQYINVYIPLLNSSSVLFLRNLIFCTPTKSITRLFKIMIATFQYRIPYVYMSIYIYIYI